MLVLLLCCVCFALLANRGMTHPTQLQQQQHKQQALQQTVATLTLTAVAAA
jgi:hypothetical protein